MEGGDGEAGHPGRTSSGDGPPVSAPNLSQHVKDLRGDAIVVQGGHPEGVTEYRYRLERRWEAQGTTLLVVALNPSTANDREDDPTTRRLATLARERGHGRYVLVNLYGARSTDPAGLLRIDDPVGPGNDQEIASAVLEADEVLLAWGVAGSRTPGFSDRVQEVLALLGDVPAVAQGMTKGGHPRHPLRNGESIRMWKAGNRTSNPA